MSLPGCTPTVAAAQPDETRHRGVTRLLVAALTLLVGWSRRARADARYVLAAAQHQARPALDPVDDHFDTALRDRTAVAASALPLGGLPPPLSHLEVLGGDQYEDVVRHLIALGKPHAPVLSPLSPALDELARDVDPRRVSAGVQYLDHGFVELVRRTR